MRICIDACVCVCDALCVLLCVGECVFSQRVCVRVFREEQPITTSTPVRMCVCARVCVRVCIRAFQHTCSDEAFVMK